MWHPFITYSEALKINMSYLNLEPDNIWIYSIQNEQVTVTVLVLYFEVWWILILFLPLIPSHLMFGSSISKRLFSFGLRTTLGVFFKTYLFSEFRNFLHVHFQSFCHFEISKIIVFSLLESLVPMWLEKFWILKGYSHFYWALYNHRRFWLYSLVRIS